MSVAVFSIDLFIDVLVVKDRKNNKNVTIFNFRESVMRFTIHYFEVSLCGITVMQSVYI